MSEQPILTAVPDWDVADRMRKALRHADVNVGEIAGYLDVSRGTVSTWINGRIEPSTQTLRLWALRCGVPYDWLRFGASPQHGGGVKTPGTRSRTGRRALRLAERVAEQVVTGAGMAA